MTDPIAGLVNDLHLMAAQGETPDGDGITVNVQLWAERWADRLAQPQPDAGSAGREQLEAAYDAGFNVSGEGWNGEYGADSDSRYYIQKRDEYFAAMREHAERVKNGS